MRLMISRLMIRVQNTCVFENGFEYQQPEEDVSQLSSFVLARARKISLELQRRRVTNAS